MYKANLVSIIVPTHNRADLLARALDSILKQTYQNWETIVVANGCRDNTFDIMERYLKDKRFILVNIQGALGGAEARNVGLDLAKGEYNAFLDDDDEWLKDKLTEQIKIFKSYKDVSLVSTNYYKYNGIKDKPRKVNQIIKLNDLLYKNYCGSFSFCMTKREFIKDIRINPNLKAFQDLDLWIKILSHSKLKCRVVQKYLVRYHRHHDNRLTNNTKQSYKSCIMFLRQNWSLMDKRQKYFQLYMLNERKIYNLETDLFYKIRLAKKALIYLIKSNYNVTFRNILRIFYYIYPIRRELFRR